MTDIFKQLVNPARGIDKFDTSEDMQAAVDAGALADGDVAFVTSEGANHFVENGSVYRVDAGPGASVVIANGSQIAFEDLVSPETVLLLAPQPFFPGMRDYAGTYPDEDLCTAASLQARNERGLSLNHTRKNSQFGARPEIQITGDLAIRAMVRFLAATTGVGLLDAAGPGETEAENFCYNTNVQAQSMQFFSESGAGVNSEAFWRHPGRAQVDRDYVYEWRRESNVLTCYINGLKLARAYDITNATDLGDGSVQFPAVTGGTSATLCQDPIGNNSDTDIYWAGIENALTGATPAEYASGKGAWTSEELSWLDRNDHAAVGAEGNVVLCLTPTENGLEDTAGTIDYATDWSVSVGDAPTKLLGSIYWSLGSGTVFHSKLTPELDIAGDLSMTLLTMRDERSASEWVMKVDTNPGGNHQYLFVCEDDLNRVRYFHRSSGGNRDISWTIVPRAAHEIREYHVRRTDNLDGTVDLECWERAFPDGAWTKLTVGATTGGSGVGTTVGSLSIATNTGAAQRLFVGDSDPIKQFIIRNVAVLPPGI